MKILSLSLISLIAVLQYQLWYGKGNWIAVWNLEDQVKIARQVNRDLQSRNTILEAEVSDLKQGFDAIEERARSELGMVKQDEIFFQVLTNRPDNIIDVNELNKLLR
ncbi:MAG: cell division protein FtsB [Nitrosomonas sp.]|nr:cell division protein FtsB [Nitrosomonas sp.]